MICKLPKIGQSFKAEDLPLKLGHMATQSRILLSFLFSGLSNVKQLLSCGFVVPVGTAPLGYEALWYEKHASKMSIVILKANS